MSVRSAEQHLGVARETTWGTGVVPAKYLAFDEYQPEDEIKTVVDNAKRGHLTKDYNVIRTTHRSMHDLEMPLYTNEIGYFLLGLFGGVTVSGVNPYTHVFKVGTTARSLTLQHYDGYEETQYAGCVVDEVTIKGDADGIITVSVKLQGKKGTVVSTTTATIDTAIKPLVGTFASFTLDAVANTNLFGWEVSFKRSNKLHFGASNSQNPTKVTQGEIEATFKLTFDIEDDTEYDAFTDQASHTLVLTFNGTASSSMVITFTAAHFEKASRDDGQENLRVDVEGRGVYNSTDGGPCQVSLTNTTASYTV